MSEQTTLATSWPKSLDDIRVDYPEAPDNVPKDRIVDIGFAAFNGFKDIMGLKKEGNTKKSDDFIRIGGDAGMLVGGAALLAGAAIAPWVPLVGAGVAAAGFLARAVGIWKDETRW